MYIHILCSTQITIFSLQSKLQLLVSLRLKNNLLTPFNSLYSVFTNNTMGDGRGETVVLLNDSLVLYNIMGREEAKWNIRIGVNSQDGSPNNYIAIN